MAISGLGPHGERAAPPDRIALTREDIAEAREAKFRVAVVLHTLASDWSRQQIAGIAGTLGDCSTVVVDVVDCGFQNENQIAALERLAHQKPDAIISIPVGNTAVADAHRHLARAGVRLILLDNVPTGLLPGTDYAALVSADNFGLGQIGAELLSPYVSESGKVGILAYGVDFFAANERELAFVKWMQKNRRDVALETLRFDSFQNAGIAARRMVEQSPDLAGLFVVWDQPAMAAVAALEAAGVSIPVTTVDLGRDAATNLARGGMIKGIGAQQPYLQGIAIAQATILSLLGRNTPNWIALPGLTVTQANVVESFQTVWRAPAPKEIVTPSMPRAST